MFGLSLLNDPSQNRSNYKLIVGCGRLGASLASQLSASGQSVVIIDQNKAAFKKLSIDYSGFKIIGNAVETNVLEEAYIKQASHVFAFTTHDATNLMVAQVAQEIYGIRNVVARLHDPAHDTVYTDLGIDTISPTRLSVDAILSKTEI